MLLLGHRAMIRNNGHGKRALTAIGKNSQIFLFPDARQPGCFFQNMYRADPLAAHIHVALRDGVLRQRVDG